MTLRPNLRQQGVAVITALLLTTLAITIVASLFWQQQVQVRSIENQRLQLQKQWILRGAVDYARLILTAADRTPNSDSLDDPWAVPLAETRLDDYVENGRADTDVPDAVLSGGIEDAQGRFNLKNLTQADATKQQTELLAFGRLLSALQLNPSLAQATMAFIASTQNKEIEGIKNPGQQVLELNQADDLLAIPAITPEVLDKLKPFVIVLPEVTALNVQTAPAEVLYARIATLTLADAREIVSKRRNMSFSTVSDFGVRMQIRDTLGSDATLGTKYFLVHGKVRLNRAGMEMQALIHRPAPGRSSVIWIREF
ncbi:type II secretion system minor pseudopilin GspK [Noviherbaspirillum saxi]|uniref:Type II secretion system protein K n=1 Tax=Noviherbaspirillum saxi TaxID=2320863 RepID=A0A3A3FSV8_9BURK|nr:type II secretion system minor pseudopilin GspK [Noviherbaspirillum saxi]RJF97568.1 general secretion pathway protein GspK [Noviherbaspirillum saxi]